MKLKKVRKMTNNYPRNLVEAYKNASQEVRLNPKSRRIEYEKVVDFCDNNEACKLESSIKHNMLLFWSYDNMAEDEISHQQFAQALEIWQKAKTLLKSPEMKVNLGQKMLDMVDKSKLNIPEKTKEIIEICQYLQQAYQELGDMENAKKMQHLKNTATNLMKNKRNKV